jgi:hypothetical protein
MHKAQHVAVDVAGVERHRLAAPGKRNPAIGVGEQQQRPTVGVGGIAGFELAGQDVDGPQRTLGPIGSGVVAAVHVGGPPSESTAPQLVVLQPIEVGVRAAWCPAFAQVDEGFHDGSSGYG